MNAYELANDLEGWSDDWLSSGNKKNVFKKHAKMLRHQADYIKHLERGLESSIALNKAQLERLTNLSKNVDELEEELLKTPQIKELSDEEIDEVLYSMDWAHDPVKFARAILKKASEK